MGEPKQPASTTKPGDEVPPGTFHSGENVCRRCHGSGKLEREPCPDCAGTGKVTTMIGEA